MGRMYHQFMAFWQMDFPVIDPKENEIRKKLVNKFEMGKYNKQQLG